MDDFVCNLYFTQQVMDDANFFFLKQKENHKPVEQLSRMPIPLENFPLDVTKKKEECCWRKEEAASNNHHQ